MTFNQKRRDFMERLFAGLAVAGMGGCGGGKNADASQMYFPGCIGCSPASQPSITPPPNGVVIGASGFNAYPQSPYFQPDGTLAFLYQYGSSSVNGQDTYKAVWNGTSWATSLLYDVTGSYFNNIGSSSITPANTEIALNCLQTSSATYGINIYRKPSGGSWSSPNFIANPSGTKEIAPYGRLVVFPSGKIRATWFAVGTSYPTVPYGAYVGYIESDDDGVTWSAPLSKVIYNPTRGANESCYFVINSTQHICVSRVEDEATPHVSGFTMNVSSDGGATWSNLGQISSTLGLYAAAPDLFLLSNGYLVMSFGNRGPIADYGSGVQQYFSCIVGTPAQFFANSGMSSVINLVAIEFGGSPLSGLNGDSGYGVMYKPTPADSSLALLSMDGNASGIKISNTHIYSTIATAMGW